MNLRPMTAVLATLLLLLPACGGQGTDEPVDGGQPQVPDGTGIPVACGDSPVTVRGELLDSPVSLDIGSNYSVDRSRGMAITLFNAGLEVALEFEHVLGDPQPATGSFVFLQHAYCTGAATTVQLEGHDWRVDLVKAELRDLRLRGACPGGEPVSGRVSGFYGYDFDTGTVGTVSGPGFTDAEVTGYSQSRDLRLEFEGGRVHITGLPDPDAGLLHFGTDIYCLGGLSFEQDPDTGVGSFTASEVTRLPTCDEATPTPGYLNVCLDFTN